MQPGERAFDDPPTPITAQVTAIVVAAAEVPIPVRDDRGHAAPVQTLAQRIAVVATVSNQPVRLLPRPTAVAPRDADGVQRGVHERDFGRTGRGDMNSERNTLAVDHHHPLRTLSAGGFADVGPPFFADTNEPSMNVFSQRSRPRASSSPRKARHMASHVPSSSHARSRRQQVDPLGYPSGKSRHRAPVFKTQRIPSTTSRLLTRGRPPFGERRGRGRWRSIWAHCASVTRTLGLGTTTSAQCRTAAFEKVQVLSTSFTRF